MILMGCGQKNAAIESVMSQYAATSVELTNSLAPLAAHPIVNAFNSSKVDEIIQHYTDTLRAIDISGCPDDFRVAFVKYYQAWDMYKTSFDSTTGLRGMLKGFLNPMAIFQVPDNTDQAMKPIDEAGRELVLVCTKYGIRFQ
jgi:hypothetical protein